MASLDSLLQGLLELVVKAACRTEVQLQDPGHRSDGCRRNRAWWEVQENMTYGNAIWKLQQTVAISLHLRDRSLIMTWGVGD